MRLALAADKRLEILPDLPTMKEAGYTLEASYWLDLSSLQPGRTFPGDHRQTRKGPGGNVGDAGCPRSRLIDMGAIIEPLNGKQFSRYIRSQLTKWEKIVKQAGLQPN